MLLYSIIWQSGRRSGGEMIVFFVWLGLIFLVLGTYIFILWKRSQYHSRFQVKLTIVFLLFVFIPTVPLTFFIANLLTRSADVLLLPWISDTLETSLETIRLQSEERGRAFFKKYGHSNEWSLKLVEEEVIDFLGVYRLIDDRVVTLRTISSPTGIVPGEWTPQQESLIDVFMNNRKSTLISLKESQIIVVYHTFTDSLIGVVGYSVPDYTLKAKDEIDRALGVYNTLSLFKQSIVEKNLIWVFTVIFVIGLALLSILTARKLSRGISEPIDDLVEGMKRVADGDLSHKVDSRAKDEFRFLVDSFNMMIHDLDVSRQKLIQTERMAVWQEIARRISHEMKNGITPISISLHKLQRQLAGESIPQTVNDSIQAVEEELRSLEIIAAEFSEFARLPKPRKSKLNLNKAVSSVVQLLEFTTGRVKIQSDLSVNIPSINADGEQIKRLLTNLIKNGVEASCNSGTVTIITRCAESPEYSIELEIKDQGEGMDEEMMKKIFHPYFTTKKEGSGLGLPIVQKIVEDHDGVIRIESQKGKGTRVVVCL
jgi:nitrogen fixation/metabolism regulation signal transduction histidine kinase